MVDVLTNNNGFSIDDEIELLELEKEKLLLESEDNDDSNQIFTGEDFQSSLDIDQDKGAPYDARAVVGGLEDKNDRLATVRNYFPDAETFGDDNFIYSDPETGRKMLFNPQGLDLGDFAGAGKEITQFSTAMGGAVMSANPFTAVATGALGSAFGESLWDSIIAPYISDGKIVDSRSMEDKTYDYIDTILWDATMQTAFFGASSGLKKLFGGGTKASQDLLESFTLYSINPTASQITSSNALKFVENSLSTSAGGQSVYIKTAEKIMEQSKVGVNNVLQQLNKNNLTAKRDLGGIVKENVKRNVKNLQDNLGKEFDVLYQQADETTSVQLNNVQKFKQKLQFDYEELGESAESVKPVLALIDRAMLDVGEAGGSFVFSSARKLKTELGDYLDPNNQITGAQSKKLIRALYGELQEDMGEALSAKNPALKKQIDDLNARYTKFMDEEARVADKIASFQAEEKAWKFVLTSGQDDAKSLEILKRNFDEKEWDIILGNVLYRMGLSNPKKQNFENDAFSLENFLVHWGELSPKGLNQGSKDVLFSGSQKYKDLGKNLDNLAKIFHQIKTSESIATKEFRAKNVVSYYLATSLIGRGTADVMGRLGGATAGYAATGSPMGATAGLAIGAGAMFGATYLTPKLTSLLLTSPKFVKWLATPIEPNQLTNHLGRLVALSNENPEMTEAISAYVQQLQNFNETGYPVNDSK